MHVTPLLDSFNRGELSPKTHYRSETEWFRDGAKQVTNFVTVARGSIKRRTGFRYLGTVAIPNTTVNVFPQTSRLSITTPQVNVT